MKGTMTLFTVLLAAVVAVGCSDQKAPTSVLEGSVDGPVTLAKGPPASSGPFVIRYQTTYNGYVFFNAAEQLVGLHSTRDGFLCGPDTEIEPLTHQTIFTPPGPFHDLDKGDLFIRVYTGTAADFWADPCDFINNRPRLAEGEGKYMFEDNELQGFLDGGTDSFGYGSEADIDDVINGGTVHYSLHRRLLIPPCNGCSPEEYDIVTTASVGPVLR